MVVAGLTAIPSAMETRYMLPFALLSYTVVLAPGWARTLRALKDPGRRLSTAATGCAALAVFLLAVVPVITATSTHLQ